VSEMLLTIF